MKGMLTAAAAALVAVVAAASALGAEKLPGKTLLGGGSIGPVYLKGAHYDLHLVSVRLLAGGKKAHFYGDLNSRCPGFAGPVTAQFDQIVPVAADGSFSGTGPIPGDLAKGTFTFSGSLAPDRASASGSGSASFLFHETKGAAKAYSCKTPNVAWKANVTPAGAPGKPQIAFGRTYYGNTSQTYPFALRAPRQGAKAVPQADLIWDGKCKVQKGGTGGNIVSPPAPLAADGSFGYVEHFDRTFSDGVVGHYTSDFKGRFGATTAAGTWHIHLDVVKADGSALDSCDSGVIKWAASL